MRQNSPTIFTKVSDANIDISIIDKYFRDLVFSELTCTCPQLPEAGPEASQPQCSEPSSRGAEAWDGCGVEIESLLKFYRDPEKILNS